MGRQFHGAADDEVKVVVAAEVTSVERQPVVHVVVGEPTVMGRCYLWGDIMGSRCLWRVIIVKLR